MTNYDKLQAVLREIFEIDKADLDFGIYRIMNQKRADINKFIEVQLPKDINEILSHTQSKDSVKLQQDLDKLGSDLDNAGVVRESSPKYLELKRLLEGSVDITAMEQEIFSHLTNFFKRYYKEGDFISQRRYKKDVYAIPYEGEEVKLHWANADQYYIKTSEYFKNYTFVLPNGNKVTFQLKEASTEQNNNKTQGDGERRFAIYEEMPIEVDGNNLYINFTYELYKKSVKQDALIKAAFKSISSNIPVEFADICASGSAPTEKNKNRTLIEKHLNDYVSRNTFDYFIHKDLGGFLRRELDFYIKNEILFIDDINTESPAFFTAQLSKIKAFKTVADKIITFLAQIEDFQKKLWLKKKFVIRTDYCITIDRIPEKYYPEIVENRAQIEEWKELFNVKVSKVEDLVFEQFLVLDTKHFSEEFKDKLIAEFYNLDEETNGLLINSENFQALNLMQERYKELVKTVHIDPPYNTETSGFKYKNNYQSSSWISFMYDRLFLSNSLLNNEGLFIGHIDHNEYVNFKMISDMIFNINQGTVVWDKRHPAPGSSRIARQHEYLLFYSKNLIKLEKRKENAKKILEKATKLLKTEPVNEKTKDEFKKWVLKQNDFSGGEKAYNLMDDDGRVFQSVHLGASEQRTDEKYFIPFKHPITGKECPVPSRGWTGDRPFMENLLKENRIIFGENENTQPRRKYYLDESMESELTSVIVDSTRGKTDLDDLLIDFPYAHSVSNYKELLWIGTKEKKNPIILDYFAGSGTTAHAIINLNREDKGGRKYILVEMGTYFDSVTKPRIQKVIYSDNWKNGKPQDKDGVSQLFKYQVLESYEDTLNNLVLAQKDLSRLGFDEDAQEEYLLQYMLDVESRDHLFNVEIFKNPFDYKLKVTENNELIPTKVDLVETFNYLIGLYVEHMYRAKDIKFVEGTTREGVKTLIIWRNLETITNSETEKEFKKRYESERTLDFHQIYINGDHNLTNFRTGEDQFKVKMIEETFFNKMFNI